MSTAIWTGLIASTLYLVATLVATRQLAGNLPLHRSSFLSLGGVALLFHLCALWHVIVGPAGLRLDLFPVASLIGATGVIVVSVTSIYRPLEWISVLVYPFSALTIPAALWIDTGIAPQQLPHGLGAHVLLSIVAYAVLALASCQAVLLLIQHHQLKDGHIRGIMRVFPPIQLMESMLFELLWTGVILLSSAVAAGFFYVEDLLAQHLVHKTFFTLASLVIFAILLAGRHLMGWRGVTAVKLTLSGFVILLLGFFGSRFVLELILQRG